MSRLAPRRAFTIVELAAVTSAVGLLMVLLQAVGDSPVRREDRRTRCLANLRQIGAASWAYAEEDTRNQLVPLHQTMVRTFHAEGFYPTDWSWRTAIPRAFGGRTATVPFPTGSFNVTVMMDPDGYWATRTRPLNGQFRSPLGDALNVFHCPADVGYPEDRAFWDLPRQAGGIPHYDMLGNSYKLFVDGWVWASKGASRGFFTSAVWGHTAGSLSGVLEETLLYADPLFCVFTNTGEDGVDPISGWHGRPMTDNAAYADGSARTTRVGDLHEFTDEELLDMGFTPGYDHEQFLSRGPSWRIDTYPTPGAQIRMYTSTGYNVTPDIDYYTGWPFDGYQFNPPPE